MSRPCGAIPSFGCGDIAGADIQADHTGLYLTALRRLSLPARAGRTSGNGHGFDGELRGSI
jgi:hypothetical protein